MRYVVSLVFVLALGVMPVIGCGEDDAVGGFLVYTPFASDCVILSGAGTSSGIRGGVENIAADKAVDVTVVATFFAEPYGSHVGATPLCTQSSNLGDIDPLDAKDLEMECISDNQVCAESYTVAFPNNHGASWSGAIE